MVVFLINKRLYFSGINPHSLFITHVLLKTLNIIIWYVRFYHTHHCVESPIYFMVSIPVSPKWSYNIFIVSCIYCSFNSSRFIIFLRLLTICGIDPGSETNTSYIYLLFLFFSHASVSYPKIAFHELYLKWNLPFILFFLVIIIFSFRRSFIYNLYCDSTWIIAHVYS